MAEVNWTTQKDSSQVIKTAYDPLLNALRMYLVGGEINISAPDDSIVACSPLVPAKYDCFSATYPDALTEVYTYKVGGLSGTTVATVTVTYSDSAKTNLVSAVRT